MEFLTSLLDAVVVWTAGEEGRAALDAWWQKWWPGFLLVGILFVAWLARVWSWYGNGGDGGDGGD